MQDHHFDTICAIASAMSQAGIGVIRISGPDSIEKIDRIFRGKEKLSEAQSHTVHYGHIVWQDTVIDEVMVLVMRAPRTYTREDTVEIDCHGGAFLMQKILKIVTELDIRVADPGEFTKRAFLNGRIDLSQAESVMDLIGSKSNAALKNSMNLLQGRLSKQIRQLREELLYEIAHIESALDDPEHYDLEGYYEVLLPKIEKIYDKVSYFVSTSEEGALIKEGIKTVIVGKPNVGKSSLLNFMAKKERAIVTEIEGTTRDLLEEQILFQGIMLRLIDTAGIRDTKDAVEKIGVQRSYDSIENADLILYVADASLPLDENDFSIMERIKEKNVIVLFNKSDLAPAADESKIKNVLSAPVLPFSAKTGEGADLLQKTIKELFFSGRLADDNEVFLANARQTASMAEAKKSLSNVMESIKNDMPEDFLSIDLMDAYEALGNIIGESVEDDLVNEIFSKFCTGK